MQQFGGTIKSLSLNNYYPHLLKAYYKFVRDKTKHIDNDFGEYISIGFLIFLKFFFIIGNNESLNNNI